VEAVKRCDVPVVAHHEVFSEGVSDEEWLGFVARKKYIGLTKDERIRSNPLAIESILSSGARVVIFSVGPANAAELSELTTIVIPKVVRSVGPRKGPCIFKVTRSGALTEYRISARKQKRGSQ
jgi:hypothetical protein